MRLRKTGAPIIEDWVSDYDEDKSEVMSGLVPISTARQSSSRAATSVSTVRPIKTAAPKSFVNVNSVNTVKGKRVTSVVGEQEINVVKSKACWVWRPKIKVLNHVSKNNGSYICKQFDYVDPTGLEFKDKTELAIPGQTATGISKEVGTLRYLSLVVPLTKVGDKDVHKELGDRIERAATTASSLEAEQDSGGYTPGCDEGRKKLNELTELCTKLSEKVTSLEQDLKQTKQVYGKALTKLVNKVKHLEDQLKSTTKRRKAKTFKSYTRRRSTDSLKVSTAGDLFSTAEEFLSTDEEIAQKLNEEEMTKVVAREGSRKY
ncbi:hypothetical protein Tco_0530768 [Tanacetum coccineum]